MCSSHSLHPDHYPPPPPELLSCQSRSIDVTPTVRAPGSSYTLRGSCSLPPPGNTSHLVLGPLHSFRCSPTSRPFLLHLRVCLLRSLLILEGPGLSIRASPLPAPLLFLVISLSPFVLSVLYPLMTPKFLSQPEPVSEIPLHPDAYPSLLFRFEQI